MKNEGFSLIELLIVFAIIGILAGIAVPSFSSWARKYYIERDIKELFADLSKARILAMNTNLAHFVVLESDGYSIYRDTYPSPFGNGTLDTSNDTLLSPKQNKDTNLTWNGGNTLEFSPKGISNTSKTICIFSDISPAYDCIVISQTRIRLGKLKTQECNADACEVKR